MNPKPQSGVLNIPCTKENRAMLRKVRIKEFIARGHTRAVAVKMAKWEIR